MEKLLKKYQYKKYSGISGLGLIFYFIARGLWGMDIIGSSLGSVFGGGYFIVVIMGIYLIENSVGYLGELVGKDRYLLRMIPLERNKILGQYIKDSIKYIFKFILLVGLWGLAISLVLGPLSKGISLKDLSFGIVFSLVLGLETINIFVIINLISILFYRFSRGNKKVERLSRLLISIGIILTLALDKLGQIFINKRFKLIFSSSSWGWVDSARMRPEKYRQLLDMAYMRTMNNELYINLAGSIFLAGLALVFAYISLAILKDTDD